MPHKRNPILSERIAGLARLLRGYAQTAFENQPLWHERDISHSSAERVILPDATILLDYMLVEDDRAWSRGWSSGRSGCARTSSAASASTPRRASCSRWSSRRPVARGGLRDRPAQRAARRRRAAAAPRAPGDRPAVVAQKLPLAALDACFDDAALLRHVPAVIARLDALEAGPRAVRARAEGGRRVPLADAFLRSGKVRDLYRVDDDRLLLVASDRLSAFDVVLPTPIPDKGRVLTGLSRFWFRETADDRPEPPARHRPGRRPADVAGGDADVRRTCAAG